MTSNETLMLIYGIGIGAQGMAVWDLVLTMRSARRSRRTSEHARRRAAGDLHLNSLRLYQLQHRSGVRR